MKTPEKWAIEIVEENARLIAEKYCLKSTNDTLTANYESVCAELDAARNALKLALEYWAHRQQRYKNRHPVWVEAARAALQGDTQ